MAEYSESIKRKVRTLTCMICGHRETFTERQFKTTDGYRCEKCNGPVGAVLTKPGEEVKNRMMNKPPVPPSQKKSEGLSIKLDIDVSDALKGLKAVERQAKKTIRALREVEEITKKE